VPTSPYWWLAIGGLGLAAAGLAGFLVELALAIHQTKTRKRLRRSYKRAERALAKENSRK